MRWPTAPSPYCVKTKDPKAFNYVITGCRTDGGGAPVYVARQVTPAHPLTFSP